MTRWIPGQNFKSCHRSNEGRSAKESLRESASRSFDDRLKCSCKRIKCDTDSCMDLLLSCLQVIMCRFWKNLLCSHWNDSRTCCVYFVTPGHSTYLSRKTNQVSSVTKKTRGSRPNSHLSAHCCFFSKVSTHHPLSHSVIYVFVLSCTHMFIRSCVETALLGDHAVAGSGGLHVKAIILVMQQGQVTTAASNPCLSQHQLVLPDPLFPLWRQHIDTAQARFTSMLC